MRTGAGRLVLLIIKVSPKIPRLAEARAPSREFAEPLKRQTPKPTLRVEGVAMLAQVEELSVESQQCNDVVTHLG